MSARGPRAGFSSRVIEEIVATHEYDSLAIICAAWANLSTGQQSALLVLFDMYADRLWDGSRAVRSLTEANWRQLVRDLMLPLVKDESKPSRCCVPVGISRMYGLYDCVAVIWPQKCPDPQWAAVGTQVARRTTLAHVSFPAFVRLLEELAQRWFSQVGDPRQAAALPELLHTIACVTAHDKAAVARLAQRQVDRQSFAVSRQVPKLRLWDLLIPTEDTPSGAHASSRTEEVRTAVQHTEPSSIGSTMRNEDNADEFAQQQETAFAEDPSPKAPTLSRTLGVPAPSTAPIATTSTPIAQETTKPSTIEQQELAVRALPPARVRTDPSLLATDAAQTASPHSTDGSRRAVHAVSRDAAQLRAEMACIRDELGRELHHDIGVLVRSVLRHELATMPAATHIRLQPQQAKAHASAALPLQTSYGAAAQMPLVGVVDLKYTSSSHPSTTQPLGRSASRGDSSDGGGSSGGGTGEHTISGIDANGSVLNHSGSICDGRMGRGRAWSSCVQVPPSPMVVASPASVCAASRPPYVLGTLSGHKAHSTTPGHSPQSVTASCRRLQAWHHGSPHKSPGHDLAPQILPPRWSYEQEKA